jgi:hypothetical protein
VAALGFGGDVWSAAEPLIAIIKIMPAPSLAGGKSQRKARAKPQARALHTRGIQGVYRRYTGGIQGVYREYTGGKPTTWEVIATQKAPQSHPDASLRLR